MALEGAKIQLWASFSSLYAQRVETHRHHGVHALGLIFSSSRNAAVRNKGMLVTMDPVILRLIAIGKVDVSQIIGDWEDGVRLVFDY